MVSANDRQVGGEHYGGGAYQHWDYVYAVKQPYHAACASKYVFRWRKKNGTEDLEKALHYVEKCAELNLTGSAAAQRNLAFWQLVLSNSLHMVDAMIIFNIQEGDWEAAKQAIQEVLSQTS